MAHPSVPFHADRELSENFENPAAIQFVHDLTGRFLYRTIAATNGKGAFIIFRIHRTKIIDCLCS